MNKDKLPTLLLLRVTDRAETPQQFLKELDYERKRTSESNNRLVKDQEDLPLTPK